MNRGIIEQSLLEKNIEQIGFYANEEYKKLKQLAEKLTEGTNYYRSTNRSLIVNNIDQFESKIDSILEKREKYVKALNEVIEQYNYLASQTEKRFEGLL